MLRHPAEERLALIEINHALVSVMGKSKNTCHNQENKLEETNLSGGIPLNEINTIKSGKKLSRTQVEQSSYMHSSFGIMII